MEEHPKFKDFNYIRNAGCINIEEDMICFGFDDMFVVDFKNTDLVIHEG